MILCNFEGNIVPDKVYIDEEGEDLSELFFLARGQFLILETNNDSGRVRSIMGGAYVRGWIGVENDVSGEIIITADQKNFDRYRWDGIAGDVKGIMLLPSFFE